MTLIKSISGIRGTIGGAIGESLSPQDIVKFTSAFGTWVKRNGATKNLIMIGRDARPSGEAIANLVAGTLQSLGLHVIDLGLSTTPTVEMAVVGEGADGGIIITASHNPIQWNALKLLNGKGEFISAADGAALLEIAEKEDYDFVESRKFGSYKTDDTWIDKHIEAILALPLVDKEAIQAKNFRIVIDAVNSTGGIAVPKLLNALGITGYNEFFCTPNGLFPHNPEPLAENLHEISSEMGKGKHDLGIVVDPDVDRLVFICEDGSMFGEEYTLVAVSDYILQHKIGNTVSNLSSTRALRDITEKVGGNYYAAAVGEVT